MKKMVLSILALVGLAVNGLAATNTPTPNATQTQAQTNIQATQTALATTATYVRTAFPSLTPTLTPTGTITPSSTFTPSPKQLKSNFRTRLYFVPSDFTQADGVTSLGASALPGSASAWMAQSLSQSVAVLSTGAAEVRLGMTVPWNYKGDMRLFLLMGAQTATDSVTLTVGVTGQHFNMTTMTAGSFSYTPPPGGFFQLNGTATNVIVGQQGIAPLWASTFVISRVFMPANAAVISYWTGNPTTGLAQIMPGDVLNWDIKRTSGGSGNVFVYNAELQYDYAQDQQP